VKIIKLSGKHRRKRFVVSDKDRRDFWWVRRWYFMPHVGAYFNLYWGGRRYRILAHRAFKNLVSVEDRNIVFRDRKKLNCRRRNLKVVSLVVRNRDKWHDLFKSKYKGVSLSSLPWRVQITHENKKLSMGYFATETKAARAYDRAAIRLHGRRAAIKMGLNFDAPGRGSAKAKGKTK